MRPNYNDLPKSLHDFIQNECINNIGSQYEKFFYVNWKKESKLNVIPSDPIVLANGRF